jgi:tetratricopeptide (TPR) repeat protein
MQILIDKLRLGFQYHLSGNLQNAEAAYQQVLTIQPENSEALHLLGLVSFQRGELEAAVNYITQAIKHNSNNPLFYNDLGNAFRLQGKFAESIENFNHALSLNKNFAEAYHNLADTYDEQGNTEEAINCYQKAISLKPDSAETYNNLGIVLDNKEALEEAIECFQKAIQLKADYSDAYNNLGTAYKKQGELQQSINCFQKAMQLSPGSAVIYRNIGSVLHDLGRNAEAVDFFKKALELNPQYVEVYNDIGMLLKDQGKLFEALNYYRQAIELRPTYVEALNNLANALHGLKDIKGAIDCYRNAINIEPTYHLPYYNLGKILSDEGNLNEAIDHYKQAIELKPDWPDSYNSLGSVLTLLGRHDEAIDCYDRALELRPDFPLAHYNRAISQLLLKNYEQGFLEFEWRWKVKEFDEHPFPFEHARWNGSLQKNRTVLIHDENGFGDFIHLIRYASLVKELVGTVIVKCSKPLERLIKTCPGIDQTIIGWPKPSDFDFHTPQLRLPYLLKTTANNIPAGIPYFSVDTNLIEQWREKFNQITNYKIGIFWQGNSAYNKDIYRSVKLMQFESLAKLDGVQLISLQKDIGVDQISEARKRFPVMEIDGINSMHWDFMDTAAVMKNLDLVVTVDSAVAHLAGALGVPVWVLIPIGPDWRWGVEGEDTPWYPTMKIFRQQEFQNWTDVFKRVSEAIKEKLNQAC